MILNRRKLLALLGGAVATPIAAQVIDPERALWVPGKKLISIPKPRAISTFNLRPGTIPGNIGVGDTLRIHTTFDYGTYQISYYRIVSAENREWGTSVHGVELSTEPIKFRGTEPIRFRGLNSRSLIQCEFHEE